MGKRVVLGRKQKARHRAKLKGRSARGHVIIKDSQLVAAESVTEYSPILRDQADLLHAGHQPLFHSILHYRSH